MKKIFGVIVLSFSLTDNAYANTDYLLEDNLFTNCDILTKKDPTSFKKMSFIEEKRIKWWDRRKEKMSTWDQDYFNAFIFQASFENGHKIQIRVNSEFKNKEKAAKQALKFVFMIGQLPNFIRSTNLRTITIHKGEHDWGGGNHDILIHTGSKHGACEEEIVAAEVPLHFCRGGRRRAASRWPLRVPGCAGYWQDHCGSRDGRRSARFGPSLAQQRRLDNWSGAHRGGCRPNQDEGRGPARESQGRRTLHRRGVRTRQRPIRARGMHGACSRHDGSAICGGGHHLGRLPSGHVADATNKRRAEGEVRSLH